MKLNQTLLYKFLRNFYHSFTNEPGGMSGRKCTAFFCVTMAGYLSYYQVTPENVVMLTVCWLLAGLLCLCVITVEQIIKLKNGYGNNKEDGTSSQG